MKRIFSVLLAVMLLVVPLAQMGVFAAPAAVGTITEPYETTSGIETENNDVEAVLNAYYGNLTYSVSNGKITITDCSTSVTYVTIPSEIDGYPVTSIGDYAFYNCSSLASIEIPSGVTSIGSSAFWGCRSLESIEIPSGVTSIGSWAFQGCRSLASIEIPSGVTSIGSWAFLGCTSLASIEIPDRVTSIGERAFDNCISLESVSFGENSQLTSIGEDAFSNCSSLESIEIPSGVTSIDYEAFYECSSLESVSFGENSQLTSIGSSAFEDCTSLESVSFGENSQLTSIGSYAFRGCSSLASIEIPSGVTSIGIWAFYECSSLKEVHISDIGAWCGISFGSMDANPLYYAKNLYLNGVLVTDLEIPAGVTSIGYAAFSGCTSLESVSFGENSQLTSIGNYAFSSCSSLESIEIPSGVTSIGERAFLACSSLDTVYYRGSSSDWSDISIGSSNGNLTGATIYYDVKALITYNANGGTEAPSPTIITYTDTAVSLSTTVPSRDGYFFKGWSETADGEAQYNAASTYTTDKNVTLYAVWEEGQLGDVNGDEEISIQDVVLLAQYCAKWESAIEKTVVEAADANGDGDVSIQDVVLLAQYCARWDVTLG